MLHMSAKYTALIQFFHLKRFFAALSLYTLFIASIIMGTDNIKERLQGDLFSRGFPKINEVYYFFSIALDQEKAFTKALATLGRSDQISSLTKVLADWDKVDAAGKDVLVPLSNALIAFSMKGLEKVSTLTDTLHTDTDSNRFKLGWLVTDCTWKTSRSQILRLAEVWRRTLRV